MLKELMATIGIGSAKVNLEVENHEVETGETLKGIIQITGGIVEQVVEKIYINLVLTSAYGTGDGVRHVKRIISKISVADKMTLKPGEEVSIPVQFKVPLHIPISKGRTQYYLLAGLDINQAIDPKDRHPVTILPNRYMKMVFEALSMLGFEEKRGFGDYNGRYQEFEYVPTTFMAKELDEIEIFPFTREQELSLAIHIDTLGLFGSFIGDIDEERYVRFRLPYNQMVSSYQIAEKLRDSIKHEYKACS